jgi:uncharacterized membrane protein
MEEYWDGRLDMALKAADDLDAGHEEVDSKLELRKALMGLEHAPYRVVTLMPVADALQFWSCLWKCAEATSRVAYRCAMTRHLLGMCVEILTKFVAAVNTSVLAEAIMPPPACGLHLRMVSLCGQYDPEKTVDFLAACLNAQALFKDAGLNVRGCLETAIRVDVSVLYTGSKGSASTVALIAAGPQYLGFGLEEAVLEVLMRRAMDARWSLGCCIVAMQEWLDIAESTSSPTLVLASRDCFFCISAGDVKPFTKPFTNPTAESGILMRGVRFCGSGDGGAG